MNKIAVIGLGYVGLPLLIELSRYHEVVGFDISSERIKQLLKSNDITGEVASEELSSSNAEYTNDLSDLNSCNIYIVTVPTPIDNDKTPDLKFLQSASEMVSGLLKHGDIVVYESTVYPGATEEFCLPILERGSQLKVNIDFGLGYSPERINPGDKENRISSIVKVIGASNHSTLQTLSNIYSRVTTAGVYEAESIKVAEAAKVIENIQRDVNIALMNELSTIFNKMGLSTKSILNAANTKWNFLDFTPGLVGGHCIGIDPYYLIYQAKKFDLNPALIETSRRTNEEIIEFLLQRFYCQLAKNRNIDIEEILILGATFKENCPDLRNSGTEKIYRRLCEDNFNVKIYDPIAYSAEMIKKYGSDYISELPDRCPDVVFYLVPHNELQSYLEDQTGNIKLLVDVKSRIQPSSNMNTIRL